MNIEPVSLDALLQIHKQEGAEGLADIAVYFAVVVGILGLLGAARKVDMPARIALAIAFGFFAAGIMSSLTASMKMHSAFHVEISKRIEWQPDLVVTEELEQQLRGLRPLPAAAMKWTYVVFNIFMLAAVLLLGEGNLIQHLRKGKTGQDAAGPD